MVSLNIIFEAPVSSMSAWRARASLPLSPSMLMRRPGRRSVHDRRHRNPGSKSRPVETTEGAWEEYKARLDAERAKMARLRELRFAAEMKAAGETKAKGEKGGKAKR
jgi:hypothetical protein